ncbi:PPM-type phosphatase-like domain [Dillenia turbinata]|uniref:protein-serine/threonine phosphatase n=1 Tax=Dillenia turbinata TaxID=194707 RepID=A0AAN8ZSE2_9MAGN
MKSSAVKDREPNKQVLESSSFDRRTNKRRRKLVTELTSSTSSHTETKTGSEIDFSSGSTEPTETELSFCQPPLRENETVTAPPRMAGVEEEKKEKFRWVSVSQGSISLIGRRRVMEDAVTVLPGGLGEVGDFFGVYDGHGGVKVAQACRDRMHRLLARELEGGEREKWEWEEVMRGCFKKMDEEVNEGDREREDGEMEGVNTVGSTAAVVVVTKEEVVVANCGDSRVVLCRGGAALPLSSDHKPDRPDEMKRVEAVGGRVINWNGFRVLGVLATSRSIGDYYLKPYVSSEPEVTVSKRTELDSFLIIASDGLWDVILNEVACDVVSRCLDGQLRKSSEAVKGNHAAEAAALLAELAMAKGSTDNISIVVVELNRPTCKEAS